MLFNGGPFIDTGYDIIKSFGTGYDADAARERLRKFVLPYKDKNGDIQFGSGTGKGTISITQIDMNSPHTSGLTGYYIYVAVIALGLYRRWSERVFTSSTRPQGL